ncbi:hypothetical protein EAF04_009493 [Stromatinia cepivora]|nr:hypothetical protein EAF04_009493 [Stromatinia cepivora]
MSAYDGGYESDTSRLRHGRDKRRDARDAQRGPPPSNRGWDYVNQVASDRSKTGSDSRAGTERSDRSDRTDRTARPRERDAPSEGGRSRSRATSVSDVHRRGSLYTEDVERQRQERLKNKNIVVREPPIRGSDAPSSYGGESRLGGMGDTRSRHSNNTITPSSHRRTPSVAASSRGPSERSRRDDVSMLSERARNMQLGEPEDPADEGARRRKEKDDRKWKQQQELDRLGINKPVKPGPSSVISGASSLVRPGESLDGRDFKMEKLSARSRGSSAYSGADPSNYSRSSRDSRDPRRALVPAPTSEHTSLSRDSYDSRDRRLAPPSYAPSYPGSSTSSRRSAHDHNYDDGGRGYAPPPAATTAAANVVIVNNTVMNNRSSNSSKHIRRSERRERLRRESFSDSDY